MKNALILTFVAALSAPVAMAETPLEPVQVLLVGDSTLQAGTGYGKALCARFRPEVTCTNLSRGGRSSKSFRVEGAWDGVLTRIKAPGTAKQTYVFIQFGHNDGSPLPARHTTMEEYAQNMRLYVEEARAAGAIPILITPVTMRSFKAGTLQGGMGPWAEATRKVGAETGTQVLDLFQESYAAVQALGPVDAEALAVLPPTPEALEAAKTGTSIAPSPPTEAEKAWFAREKAGLPHPPVDPNAPKPERKWRPDYTHYGTKGAELFSGIVVAQFPKVAPALVTYVLKTCLVTKLPLSRRHDWPLHANEAVVF